MPERARGVAPADAPTVAIARQDFRRRRWARRWRRTRPFLLVGLVLAVLAGGVWLVYFSAALTVRDVQVTGNSTLDPVRIRTAAEVPMDQQLARVDVAAIQARVEALPAVRAAQVSRSWPHTVQIAVTERVPVAAVDRGTGLQAVDRTGVLFDGYRRRPATLPLIRSSAGISTEALAEAARVIAALPAGIQRRVNYLDVRSVDRIELLLHDGRKVLWGSAGSSDQKAEVLSVLLAQKAQKMQKVQRIDVSVPGRPTTQ